jgi:hypothetical protein
MVKPIATAGGIDIYSDKKSRHSFFASPYQAHRDFAAVDITQNKKFGDVALSPVTGKIIKILEYESPTINGKSLPEYLILIENKDKIARIMHLKPTAKVGDKIAVGDELGTFIKNGFFSYWVDPTIHVEIREKNNLIRPRGGLELKPILEEPKLKPTKEIAGTVTETSPRNTTIKTENKIIATIKDQPALLDGTTNLDYAGLIGRFSTGESVYLCGIEIGEILNTSAHANIYKTKPLYISVNNIPFEGLHFNSSASEIKILPKKYGETKFKIGEKVKIEIKGKC